MPDDSELVAEVRAWLAKAELDLRAGRHEFTAVPPLLHDIVFHAQQAAEKALKAFLAWHQTPFRKTHSLEELGEQCLALDSSLNDIVDRAAPLTEYAWKFRYPGEVETPTDAEATQALSDAQVVYDAIVSRLPAAAHPAAQRAPDTPANPTTLPSDEQE
jgi:HEPN domain-containing protein